MRAIASTTGPWLTASPTPVASPRRRIVPGWLRSSGAAAILSALLPGLGQLAEGRRRVALLWALPALLTVVVVVGAGAAVVADAEDRTDWLAILIRPDVLRALLIIDLCLLVYHAAASVDAWWSGDPRPPALGPRSRVLSGAFLAVALVGTVAMHAGVGLVAARAGDAMEAIFVATEPGGMEIPEPGFADSEPAGDGVDAEPGDDGGGIAVMPEPTEYLPEPTEYVPEPTDVTEPTAGPAESTDVTEPTAGPTGAPTSGTPVQRTPTPAAATQTASPIATSAATSTASPTASPAATPTPTPAPTPRPTPKATAVPAWARDGRLNLLLVGSDAGPDRWSLRTDTLIVLSVSTKTGRAAMFGVPRNLVNVPLAPEDAAAFPDGRFPQIINELYTYAMAHPGQFPGGESRGYRAVAGAIQELVGVRLDGMVLVNLAGFVRLVNAVGGLWIDVPYRVIDTFYPLEDGTGHITVEFDPGCQHLDGRMALAYARSRQQDSDYGRMHRQQLVLLAFRRQLDPVALIPRIPDLLDAAGATLWTTLKPADLAGIARLARRVDATRVETVFFVPHAYPQHLDDEEIDQIRSVVRNAFTHPAPPARAGNSSGSCAAH